MFRLLVHWSLVAVAAGCAASAGTTTAACKQCNAALIMVTVAGAGAKPMDDDMIVTTGNCATRTFTCNGNQATIEWNGGARGTTQDGGTGTAVETLTCNASGTAWLISPDNTPITQAECAAV